MLADDGQLRAWLPTWREDGGDARRFRQGMRSRFGGGRGRGLAALRAVLTPLRLRIREVARALLVYPRHLPYQVAAAIADGAAALLDRPVPGGETLKRVEDHLGARAGQVAAGERAGGHADRPRAGLRRAAAMSGGLSPT